MSDAQARFERFGNLLQTITYNGNRLLLTAFISVVLLYQYSLFAFTYVDDTFFNFGVEPAGESYCHTLIHCFTKIAALAPR